jgi:hypothetical protein
MPSQTGAQFHVLGIHIWFMVMSITFFMVMSITFCNEYYRAWQQKNYEANARCSGLL